MVVSLLPLSRTLRWTVRCPMFSKSNHSSAASSPTVLLSVEQNNLSGSLDSFCSVAESATVFSDCGGTDKEVTCECCDQCCQDDVDCHDMDLFQPFDPTWEVGYAPQRIEIDGINGTDRYND